MGRTRLKQRCIIVSVLTHEAFQYLTMIRRTKVVNGLLIESYEDPLDDDSEEFHFSRRGHEDTVPITITKEGERLLCVGGQKAAKRAEVREEVTSLIIIISSEHSALNGEKMRASSC